VLAAPLLGWGRGRLPQRVVVDARSMLIFAGWLPQDGVRQEWVRGL
jgi:hypothetical protein